MSVTLPTIKELTFRSTFSYLDRCPHVAASPGPQRRESFKNQKCNRGCCSLLDSDPISRFISEFVADHLTPFRIWNLREIENHSDFGFAFAELTQLRTFAKQK